LWYLLKRLLKIQSEANKVVKKLKNIFYSRKTPRSIVMRIELFFCQQGEENGSTRYFLTCKELNYFVDR